MMPVGFGIFYLKKAFLSAYPSEGHENFLSPMTKSFTSAATKLKNMFRRIKDWRRIVMRYDRCAHTFFSAICIAAAVIFYLNE